jgi:hypothetical protein
LTLIKLCIGKDIFLKMHQLNQFGFFLLRIAKKQQTYSYYYNYQSNTPKLSILNSLVVSTYVQWG